MPQLTGDHAKVIAPPPLIFAGVLVVGLIISYLAPVAFLPRSWSLVLGALFLFVGIGIASAAIVTMHRAGTSPNPRDPVRALVTRGPYQFTRNPIYLSFAIIYLSITVFANALAALILLPIALVIIHIGVITREEEYLGRTFGDNYAQYKKTVRRWI